jgi:hypothetical protein
MNYQEEIDKLIEQIINLKLKKKLSELETEYGEGCKGLVGIIQETNLEKAARLYPEGTRFIDPLDKGTYKSTGHFHESHEGDILDLFPGLASVGNYIRYKGQWAEIIKE